MADEHSPTSQASSDTRTDRAPLGPEQLPEPQPVLISRYLREGWDLLWGNPALHIGYTVMVLLVMFVLQSLWGVGQLLTALVVGPLMAGYYFALRRQLQGHPLSFGDFLAGFNEFVPLMLVGLVTSLLTTLGFFLLVLPGIYLLVGYLFALPLVQDRKLPFWDAMETSRRAITRQWFHYFGLVLVLIVVNALGGIPAGLGLLLTIPFSMAVVAAAYNHQIGFRPAIP